MFIEIINGKATGAWSKTPQEWATFEIDELPKEDLSFYRLVDGKLVFDEKIKIEIKTLEDNEKVKMELETYLKETDWYVLRFFETGKEIPIEISEKRQKARDKISELENNTSSKL